MTLSDVLLIVAIQAGCLWLQSLLNVRYIPALNTLIAAAIYYGTHRFAFLK